MPALCKKLIIPVLAIGLMVPYFSAGVFAQDDHYDDDGHEHDDHDHDWNESYPFYVAGDPEKGVNILDGMGGSHQSTSEELEEIREQIERQEERLQELRREAREQEKQIEETRQYADSLAGFINNVNRQINQLERSINIRSEELFSIRLAIQRITLEIRQYEERIEASEDQMVQLFREVYRNDSEGVVELLFKYEEFSAFFNQVQARRSLQTAIDETLRQLKLLKEQLEGSKAEMDEKREELEAEQATLRDQKIVLEQTRMQNQLLLQQTRGEESAYQERLNAIRAAEEAISREIFELEDRLRQTLDPGSVPGASGIFTWPAPSKRITQAYGCVRSWNSVYSDGGCGPGYSFHNGLDLGGRTPGVPGDPIYAAQSGTVVGVGDLGNNAYGRWVAIDHHNGLTTLYAHLSLQRVRRGQVVQRGDVVGLMGSTGFSTAPHLHFTVYASSSFRMESRPFGLLPIGASLQPLNYLP